MSRILSIFRKDARHLWPQIGAFLILLALAALLDPTYTSRDRTVFSVLGFLLPLACAFVVIAVVHEEKLPGDRQYWLTRPITGIDLLAAKALFVVVFLNLPVFLCHLAVLAAVGIPPFAYLPALLWRQVFLSAFYILPVAVLAAITRSLGQVVLAGLLLAIPLGPQAFFLARLRMERPAGEWMTNVAVAAVLAVGAVAVLTFQYSRRRTALSRALTGAVVLAGTAATFIPIDRAFPQRPVPAVVSITLDHRTGPPPNPASSTQRTVALEFPVRVEGIPPGAELVKNRLTAGVRASGRLSFGAPRYIDGGLHDLSNGAGWLTLVMDRDFFAFAGKLSVTMTGSLDFTLFQPLETVTRPAERGVVVPRVGVCSRAVDATGWNSIVCYTPFPQAALYVRMPRGGANWIVPGGFVGPPVPTAAGFQPLTAFSNLLPLVSSKETGGAQLVTARPLARSNTPFEFPGIRLADYASQ